MMGFFEIIEGAGHWIGDRIDDLGKFASSLWQDGPGREALPAPELIQKVLTGGGTNSWHVGAGQAQTLSSQHNEAGDLLSRVNSGLESAWTGAGSEAAKARVRNLAETAASSAAIYGVNGSNLTDIAHGFDAMKSSLQQLPPVPPHRNFFDRISPWETDTEKEISEYNAVAQQNVDRYQAYAQHARTNSQNLQSDYGGIDGFGDQHPSPGPGQGPPNKDRSARLPTAISHRPPSSPEEPHARDGAPAPADRPAGPAMPGLAHGPGGVSTPGAAPHPRTSDQTTTTGWTPNPATTRDWLHPIGAPRADGSESSSTWSPGPAGGLPAQSGRGDPSNVGRNSRGETGRTGGNSEARAGSSSRPGAGKGAGEEGRPATTPARTTTGAPGSRGAPGVSGPTPHRGKAEDSKDHHRKYGLETDSAFSLTDDDGERAVDPRTGLPPTPPTIGG
ncbi:hypothetical protein [Amycolatopsis rubida]|nr:hypothetical protein [Amycolatopsis rubida]